MLPLSLEELFLFPAVNRFVDNTIQVSRNNVVYFCAILRDGIFEIDLSNSLTNESSVYAVSNKRAKLDLDSALLWHCRLGHISKKRIKKLQHDGLLNSSDLTAFEKYEVENQLGKTIKSLHSDHGGEYISQEFLDHLKDHGIIAHRTPPYTPQHNGVSERRNRTLLDMVRSMMSQTTLPKSFWDYALETVARIFNMVPTKKVEKTPYEVWHGKVSKLSYLVDTQRKQWDIPSTTHPRTNLIDQEASGSLEDLEIIQEEDMHPSLDTSLNHEEDDEEIDEPQSDIVPIRSKWLFKKKTNMDGNVHIYKAFLVAKGFTQTPGIDYDETFSLVADIRAIRILIAIAAYYDYEIWQIDVKTAFLNGYLNEE
nr:retrotransposon protein, putative, Ty1-copia subclass [Tanacetum cinerariifolium]